MTLEEAVEEQKLNYKNPRITNIRSNKRTGNIHAILKSDKGELLISATLEYIVEALAKRMP